MSSIFEKANFQWQPGAFVSAEPTKFKSQEITESPISQEPEELGQSWEDWKGIEKPIPDQSGRLALQETIERFETSD